MRSAGVSCGDTISQAFVRIGRRRPGVITMPASGATLSPDAAQASDQLLMANCSSNKKVDNQTNDEGNKMIVSNNSGARTYQRRSSERVTGWALPFVLAFSFAASSPALARSKYDGDWSVLIATHRGACEPALRYGVQIADGAVIADAGEAATVKGRVSLAGAIRVAVRSGNAWAIGSGHLGRNSGGGVWSGEGTSGACSGTWVARRRGSERYAGELNAPGTVVAQAHEAGGPDAAYCEERFRSYDPTTGTYLGYDDARHRCP
jgi:BA14K-like protein